MAKQFRRGWKLGYCIENDRPIWVKNVLFATPKDVEKALRQSIVFVHLKEAPGEKVTTRQREGRKSHEYKA